MWWIAAAGLAMQAIGQYRANQAQADGEEANARFYQEQENFAKEAMFREQDITARDYEFQKGKLISAYGAGGVDVGSGSAALQVADVAFKKASELDAIKRKGMLDIKLARERKLSSVRQASELRDPINNIMQIGGTAMSGYSAYAGRTK